MREVTTTGEIKFGSEPTGLFISHSDAKIYMNALHSMMAGRKDPIVVATFYQFMQLLSEASDDDIGKEVYVCKNFDDCKLTKAYIDNLMKV